MTKFRDRFLAGETDFDEIFDLTDTWNMSDETCTLRTYLGLTAIEEDIWVSDSDEALEEFMEKEKLRKIFFTDLDGTLLTDEKKISAENRKHLEEMLANGHVITISTGRAYPSALQQAKKLGLVEEGCYIICYNGGQIYDAYSKELLFSASIPNDLTRACYQAAEEMGIHLQAYTREDVVAIHENETLKVYCKVQNLPYKTAADPLTLLSEETPKLLAINDDPAKLTAFRSKIAEIAGDKLDAFQSSATYLEIVPSGVNKGNAVRFLSEKLYVPISRTISAGDAENDKTMIEAAGVGAVMINGTDGLKAVANYITTRDNNHDGVAEIIDKFILNA